MQIPMIADMKNRCFSNANFFKFAFDFKSEFCWSYRLIYVFSCKFYWKSLKVVQIEKFVSWGICKSTITTQNCVWNKGKIPMKNGRSRNFDKFTIINHDWFRNPSIVVFVCEFFRIIWVLQESEFIFNLRRIGKYENNFQTQFYWFCNLEHTKILSITIQNLRTNLFDLTKLWNHQRNTPFIRTEYSIKSDDNSDACRRSKKKQSKSARL